MIADGFRQAVFGPEEIDGPSLTVAVGEDCCPGALLRWKTVVDSRSLARHFFPAEFVREVLRKRACLLVFCSRRFETERSLVANVSSRSQDGCRYRSQRGGDNDDQNSISGLGPFPVFLRQVFQTDSPGSEQ